MINALKSKALKVSFVKRLLGRSSYPLNTVYILKDRLISNYQTLLNIDPKNLPAGRQVKIAPVLKSNAYGHGIEEVGKIVDKLNAPFICVDSLYEAYQLKKAGIKSQILIMGYIDPESLKGKKLPFSYAVWDLNLVEAINNYQNGAKIHIFVDTGMNREGVKVDDLKLFLRQIKALSGLQVEGLMSHLACADEPKNPLNRFQLENFKRAKIILKDLGFKPKWIHLGGSDGLLNGLIDSCNLYRVGLAMYQGSLKFTTKIVQIKRIKKGEKIGYLSTFTAIRDMVVAVLPLGFNDGVDRALSAKGKVLIDGAECPLVGLVSMNVCVADISGLKSPCLDQEVVVFSDDSNRINSIENSAKLSQKTPYEFLVHLHPSTKRVVV